MNQMKQKVGFRLFLVFLFCLVVHSVFAPNVFAQEKSPVNTAPVRRVITDKDEIITDKLVTPSEPSRTPYAMVGLFLIAVGAVGLYFFRRQNNKTTHGD